MLLYVCCYTYTYACPLVTKHFQFFTGGTQKLHFNPKPEDVKAVVQKFAAEGKFGIIAMLFLGGTSTIPKGSGGFATACRCKFPEFPLAEFIATQSPAQYSRSDLLKQLLRCGASPDGPSHRDNPSWNAWKTEQDDLLAILIKNGASLSGLMTNLFSHISPDNMLHGAVKNAILTGEIVRTFNLFGIYWYHNSRP